MNRLTKIYRQFIALNRRKKATIIVAFFLLVWYIFCLPSPLFDVPYSTLVSDRNSEMLGARIAVDGQWRFPPTNSISEKYYTCLIQFEDKNFRWHPGVDILSIGRAFKQNYKAKRIVSGGSTITMQTIRLMRKDKRTYLEKFIEVILATRLELSFSKNKILMLYASHAPMGGNVVGVDAASWRYFGHDPMSMSWAEAATLAVLPNSPSEMHFGRKRDKLLRKRNALLKRLYDKEKISEADYKLALDEPLPESVKPLPQIAPHLVTQLYMRNPGNKIYSTINKHLQKQADEVLSIWNRDYSQKGVNNLAALIVDLESNEVLVYCGNVNFNEKKMGNQVDIIQAPRSTGSILKPFLYCSMIQDGLLLPKELLPDVPVNFGGFTPKNFSMQYDGAVHADEALARSLNVPTVVALRKYSVPKFYNKLKEIGFSTINRAPDHYGLSIILGGAEASLWEISRGYAEMAYSVNDYSKYKKYYKHSDFKFIKTEKDERPPLTTTPIFNAGAAWNTLEALTNENRPEELDRSFIPSLRRVAWKTGTSFGFRDAWAVGITPRYLVGVWVGNASGEGKPGLTGARMAVPVMFDLFNLLPSTGWFDTPYGELTDVAICRESGCLKGFDCPITSVDTIMVPLKAKQGPVCEYHRIVHLSTDEKYRVYEQCAAERGIKPKSMFILPASWEWYFKQIHPWYKTLPPYAPECNNESVGSVMQFIYPYPNSVITLAKQLDGSPGKAVFNLAHRNSSAQVFWHLDNEYVGETTNIHQLSLSPLIGDHTLTVVDNDGNSLSVRFKIK